MDVQEEEQEWRGFRSISNMHASVIASRVRLRFNKTDAALGQCFNSVHVRSALLQHCSSLSESIQ